MLFNVWKASGADPYRTYNNLDRDYRPIGEPSAAPRPPKFPERVRAFLYACGSYARELERMDLREHAQALAKAMGGR